MLASVAPFEFHALDELLNAAYKVRAEEYKEV